jgi:hypothetical protein
MLPNFLLPERKSDLENLNVEGFGHKRDEVTKEQGKIHNEELHDLFSSPIIVQLIKARRIRNAVHVGRAGEGRSV